MVAIVVFISLFFVWYTTVRHSIRCNVLIKAVSIGNLIQVFSTLFLLYNNIIHTSASLDQWIFWILIGEANNIAVAVGLLLYRPKSSFERLSLAPLIVLYGLILVIRILFPISIQEMHTAVRISGAGDVPFVVSQLRVLLPLATFALFISFLTRGYKVFSWLFVLLYLAYSFYLGNRGDLLYGLVGSIFLFKVVHKREVKIFGFPNIIGALVLLFVLVKMSDGRTQEDVSILTSGASRLGNLRIAEQILTGRFARPYSGGLAANLFSFIPASVFDSYGYFGQPFPFTPSLGYAAAYFNGIRGAGYAVPIAYEFVWWFGVNMSLFCSLLFGVIVGLSLRLLSRISNIWSTIMAAIFIGSFISMEDMTTQFWAPFARYVILTGIFVLINKSLWKRSVS